MSNVTMTLDEAREKLGQHFGAGKIPSKYLNLLDWWQRLLADPQAPPRMRMACERDLTEILGPIVGDRVEWLTVMSRDDAS